MKFLNRADAVEAYKRVVDRSLRELTKMVERKNSWSRQLGVQGWLKMVGKSKAEHQALIDFAPEELQNEYLSAEEVVKAVKHFDAVYPRLRSSK